MIKALVFDCFGVLYNDILKDMLKRHVITDPQITGPCFDAARANDVGKISLEAFIAELSRLTKLPLSTVKAEMSDTSHLNLELINIVESLKPTYKIGMITDVDSGLIKPFLTNQNVEAFFDVIVISSEAGCVKPAKEIYELAVERLNIDTSEIIYIDNSIINVEAAKEIGMTGVLYENIEQFKHELQSLVPVADAL